MVCEALCPNEWRSGGGGEAGPAGGEGRPAQVDGDLNTAGGVDFPADLLTGGRGARWGLSQGTRGRFTVSLRNIINFPEVYSRQNECVIHSGLRSYQLSGRGILYGHTEPVLIIMSFYRFYVKPGVGL